MTPPWQFLGREPELLTIRRAAQEIHSGVTRFVLIEGPAGVGKSSLLNEAVSGFEGWRSNIYLDPADQRRPGYAARHLLPKGKRSQAPRDQDGLTDWVQASADLKRDPGVLVVEDFQWVDELSSDIIFDVTREISEVPLLILVTMRTTVREDLLRFSRLAETVGEATRMVLEPFTAVEVQHHLRAMTGMPIGERAATAVHQRTDGFPQFVETVGRSLGCSTLDLGMRLNEAFAALETSNGPVLALRRLIRGMLKEQSEEVTQMLLLLACAHRSLSTAEIGRALESDVVDVDGLRRSTMVLESTTTARFRIRHRILEEAIVTNFSNGVRSQMHRRLAEGDQGEYAARHRGWASWLEPENRAPEGLSEELAAWARRNAVNGDRDAACDLARLAFTIDRNKRTLESWAFAALRAGRISDLAEEVDWIREMIKGPLQRAVLARLTLDTGDHEAALLRLGDYECLRGSRPEALIVYGNTVIQVTRSFSIRGDYRRASAAVDVAMAGIHDMERRLSGPEAEDLVADLRVSTPEQLLAELISTRAALTMWKVLDESGEDLAAADSTIEELLGELSQVAGTRHAQATLRAVRGARRRVAGDRIGAHQDLQLTVQNWHSSDPRVLAYASVHLTLLYFDTGRWDQAHSFALKAASQVLSVREELLAAIVYSLIRLVPSARARSEEFTWEDERLNSPGELDLPLADPSRWLVRAWEATAVGDHRAVVRSLLKMRSGNRVWANSLQITVLLGRSYLYSGRGRAIVPLLREVAADTVTEPRTRDYVLAHLRGLDALESDAPEQAVKQYLQALDMLVEEPGFPDGDAADDGGTLKIYRAILALDLGYCVATHRHVLPEYVARAKETLAWAASVFETCDSAGLFQQADHLFIALHHQAPSSENGVPRPRFDGLPAGLTPTARTALTVLTSREREISLMVGRGLPNKEVAQHLVISVRTVEYHVANVLGKLRLKSRHDLRGLLGAEPTTSEPDPHSP